MCHVEQAEGEAGGGVNLWEPNLKNCHDGSWKSVKVGGSVIFKDEPRGKADRKQGQIWQWRNRRRKNRRRMQSYFHSHISFSLLLIVDDFKVAAWSGFGMRRYITAWVTLLTVHRKAASPAGQTPRWRGRGEKEGWWWTSWSSWETRPGSWERPSIWREETGSAQEDNRTRRCSTQTHLVILKILRSLRALKTLIPNDMPGLKKPQTTSKMLPTMT